MIDKYSAIKLLLAESVISPLVKIAAALVITPLSPILIALTSFLYGFGNVASDSLQQREFTDEQRGTMSSLVSLGGSLCFAAAAFVLGAIADEWGVAVALVVAQLVLLTTNYFYIKIYRLPKISL